MIVRINLVLLATVGLAACGGDDPAGPGGPGPRDNVPPTLAAVADQSVVLNTLTASSIAVELQIDDPDDTSFSVVAVSDAPTIIARFETTCGAGACELILTPQATASTTIVVTVTVSDGAGDEVSTSFAVHVSPRLVTSVANGGPGSLRQVIAAAEPGDVIGFDTEGAFGGPETITLNAQLVLDETLSIVGPGTGALTLSGNGVARVFRVQDGADVAVENLTVAAGVAPLETLPSGEVRLGGCLLVAAGSGLTLDGVRVTGCDAPADVDLAGGGGVANLDATLVVRNSEIEANTAGQGGGVASIALGGSATTTIANSAISNNSAASNGGGVYNTGTLEIVSETVLSGNETMGNGGLEGGGGLFNAGTATIVDSQVSQNSAHDGGGIFNATDAVLSLASVSVDLNDANVGGGGIFTLGALSIETSVIVDNQAPERGGGIDHFGGPGGTVSQTVIRGNRAQTGAGVNVFLSSEETTFSIVDSEILENEAASVGGGVSVFRIAGEPGPVTIAGTTIADNSALHGGGIAVRGGALLRVADSDIEGNGVGGDGGGVYLSDFDDARFRGTRITGNTAMRGGGIHAEATGDGSAQLAIQELSSITENTATEFGGGVSGVDDSSAILALSVLLQNSHVSDNQSSVTGGGIYIREGFLALFGGDTGVSIERNVALSGGGITAIDAHVHIFGPSVIVANRAANDGGGMVASGTTVLVDGSFCMILGNEADTDQDGSSHGGGIFYNRGADLSGVPSERVCLNDPDDIAGR